MKFSIWWIVGLVAAIAALHFWGVYADVYEAQIEAGLVWFDNVLHFFVGIAFGLLWLWLISDARILSTLAFVFLLAFLWESAEFILLFVFPDFAHQLSLYSTSLDEASFDILSDLAGAAVLLLAITTFRNKTVE